MFKYKLYYDGGFLRDSADLGYTFETEEEAKEDAEMEIESRIADWENCVDWLANSSTNMIKMRRSKV